MEKRINQKTRTYLQQFKNDIKEFVTEKQKCLTKEEAKFFYSLFMIINHLEFCKTDFQKEKELKMLFLILKDVVL